jgi:hypothetical protein
MKPVFEQEIQYRAVFYGYDLLGCDVYCDGEVPTLPHLLTQSWRQWVPSKHPDIHTSLPVCRISKAP